MNYLLSSARVPFAGQAKATDPQRLSAANLVQDDTLNRMRAQQQQARDELRELIHPEDDGDSVQVILNDSGLTGGQMSGRNNPKRGQKSGEKGPKPDQKGQKQGLKQSQTTSNHAFDYDKADKLIKERESQLRLRELEMAQRLKLKEEQLRRSQRPQTLPLSHQADAAPHEPHLADDSIDATMRKASSSPHLVPSPLPSSPPENIRKWRDKISRKRYELPSQEERRLEMEWEKRHLETGSGAKGADSGVDERKLELIDQVADLQGALARCEREKEYWRLQSEVQVLERESMERQMRRLEVKLDQMMAENEHLGRELRRKEQKEVSVVSSRQPRIPYDIDDTAQLLKYASRSMEYKPRY